MSQAMSMFWLGAGVGIVVTFLVSAVAYLLLAAYFGGMESDPDAACENCRMPRIEA